MHCIELLGPRLFPRGVDRQVANLRVRIAVRNDHTTLGTTFTVPIGRVGEGREEPRSSHGLCSKAASAKFRVATRP